MFIGNDRISETVNDSDSDGGNFSELSDSDTSKVHSPFLKRKLSSQNLTEAGRKQSGPFINGQIQILS